MANNMHRKECRRRLPLAHSSTLSILNINSSTQQTMSIEMIRRLAKDKGLSNIDSHNRKCRRVRLMPILSIGSGELDVVLVLSRSDIRSQVSPGRR